MREVFTLYGLFRKQFCRVFLTQQVVGDFKYSEAERWKRLVHERRLLFAPLDESAATIVPEAVSIVLVFSTTSGNVVDLGVSTDVATMFFRSYDLRFALKVWETYNAALLHFLQTRHRASMKAGRIVDA